MMYCTVFMYGLDGRLSPLSYNYVCRVSIIKNTWIGNPSHYSVSVYKSVINFRLAILISVFTHKAVLFSSCLPTYRYLYLFML